MPKRTLVAAALIAYPVIACAQDPAPKSAPALATACFEVTALPAAQRDAGGVLRINRCSGETWLLVRTSPAAANPGRDGYEWMPIPLVFDPATHARLGAKCFTFSGKQYCE